MHVKVLKLMEQRATLNSQLLIPNSYLNPRSTRRGPAFRMEQDPRRGAQREGVLVFAGQRGCLVNRAGREREGSSLAGAGHKLGLRRHHHGPAHRRSGPCPGWLISRGTASLAVTATRGTTTLWATGAAGQHRHDRHRRYDKHPSHLWASFRRRLQVGNQLYNAVSEVQMQPVIFFNIAMRFFNARTLNGSYICSLAPNA